VINEKIVLVEPFKKMEQILVALSNEISFYENKKQKRKANKEPED